MARARRTSVSAVKKSRRFLQLQQFFYSRQTTEQVLLVFVSPFLQSLCSPLTIQSFLSCRIPRLVFAERILPAAGRNSLPSPAMPPYSSSQKQLLSQFMTFTEAKDSTAAKVLSYLSGFLFFALVLLERVKRVLVWTNPASREVDVD